ncbi:MAG: DUF4810 domain-containing protein [Muribaculaceae bacterium]|nr:DUF4810 domain-containing protein [Muribaculaceae bacterium]
MKFYKICLISTGLLVLTSCGSSSKNLYSWKDYERATYAYTKEPSDKHEAELIATYQQMIDKPQGERKVVPPGVCAELGYIYFKKGDKVKAMHLLEKEMELYPESQVFIKRIIDAVKK